jgi:hypothetical protein
MKIENLQARVEKFYGVVIRNELWVFALLLLISMLQLWIFKYLPSLDGPQHLYNSNVIIQLLKGSGLFGEFYRINEVIVGYWTGHFALTFFNLFLPAWLAEKMFLSAYVFGVVFSFRYLVRSINPEKENLLVYLIFPFVFHNYLMLGYYSFSISVIFFFLAFGYWIRHSNRFRGKEMALFGALVLGIFLSHGLVFLFFGAAFLIYVVLSAIYSKVTGEKGFSWRELITRLWRLAVSVLPALLLWVVYIRKVMGINPTVTATSYYKMELVGFILRIRQLVGFNHEMESPAYRVLFGTLALLSLLVLISYIRRRRQKQGHWIEIFSPSQAWIFISLMFLTAYFFAPDRISAGSLTNRFGLFFFLALLVCLASQTMPKWAQLLALVVVVGVMASTRAIHCYYLEKLNRDISEIQEMSPHMKDGSTVFSINSSNNWIHRHFQLYVADEKELVHLKNPQCAGQFPVKWNERSLPECYLGDQWVKPDRAPDIRGEGHRKLQVDYITVYSQLLFWEAEDEEKWQQILEEYYELVMITSGKLGALYQRKQQ